MEKEQKRTSAKNGIGYSPLTDKVYIGKQNITKGMWIGGKTDITNQFIDVSFAYFEENNVREIKTIGKGSNLFINIKNDRDSIERAIKHLTKRLENLTA